MTSEDFCLVILHNVSYAYVGDRINLQDTASYSQATAAGLIPSLIRLL